MIACLSRPCACCAGLLLALGLVGGVPAAPPATLSERQAMQRQETAEQMFRLAERCRRAGDLDRAYSCYYETILLCPGSACAEEAQQRLAEIDRLRAVDAPAEPEAQEAEEPVAGEQACLQRLQRVAEQLRRQSVPCLAPPTAPAPQADRSEGDSRGRRIAEAREMFRRAEQDRRAGNLDRAYLRYQQTHLICPDCSYGRKAMKWVQRIEMQALTGDNSRTGEAEEAENRTPKPQKNDAQRRRKLYESTEPLETILEGFISLQLAPRLW